MSETKMTALGTQPIGSLLIKQAVPASIGILVMSLNILVDTIFVGNWIGSVAIAAINVVLPVSFFVAALGMSIGIGGSSVLSRALGKQDMPKALHTFGNQITLTFVLITVLVAVCLFFTDNIIPSFGGRGMIFEPAKIYYIDGATTGFDNGYDGPMFTGSNNSFAVYTHLVSDSEGVDYQIQSLPPDDYGNMVTPIGINAVSGSTISIEASTFDFPEGMNIYLEDKEDNSFTLLDGDANFTTTLESDLNGIGRFYLHTTTGSLSADDLSIRNNISIYNSSKENLRIVGVKNGTNAKVHLYTILGKEVFTTSFQGVRVNDILLPKLAEGVYIIKLSTMNSKTIKKIIL